MPVIELDFQKLKNHLNFEISREEFLEMIPSIGADVERVEGDELAIEFFPDRPDLYSVEGVARAFSGLYSLRKGLEKLPALPAYPVHPSDVELVVDPVLMDIRPYIGCAVIKGLKLDDRDIQGLMNFQEKLHLTIGRKRTKVAIGIHDMDAITPPFRYYAADPDACSFVPLGKTKEMNLRQILDQHEKGIAYKYILQDKPRYPVIEDSEGYTLSFPPIINGTQTTVTTDTTSVFLDITGTHEETVLSVLNIVACSFAGMGGEVHGVKLTNVHGKQRQLPDLSWQEIKLSQDYISRLLGTNFLPRDTIHYLRGMGFDAGQGPGDDLVVKVPPYRVDILHPVDLVEDVAIGHGYTNFEPQRLESMTYGRKLRPQLGKLRNYMVGMGFTELMTLILSSEEEQYLAMGLPEPEDGVKIHNPITKDHTTLRSWLAPGLLATLRKNRHRDLPQRVYELDYVFSGTAPRLKLEALEISSNTGFSDAKAHMNSLLGAMERHFLQGFETKIRETSHSSFIPGRVAELLLVEKESGEEQQLGLFGELHPEVISNFSLENPVSYLGIELQPLAEPEHLD